MDVETSGAIEQLGRRIDALEVSLRSEFRAGFAKLGSRFDGLEPRFDGLESRFDTMESGLEARFAENRRHTDVLFESLRDDIRMLAEAFATLSAKRTPTEGNCPDSGVNEGRSLRRRLHAHLSRADVSRRRVSGLLRALRHGRRPAKFAARGRQRRAAPQQPRRCVRSGDLHRLHESHHRADGRARTAGRRVFAGDLREWAACQHFELYDDVPAVLRSCRQAGLRIGLISNTHRCLASFQSHFELQGLISATVSSSDHGFMKPHPSIFSAALQLLGVAPAEAVMVGDSLRQDVEGALRAGMRGDSAEPRRQCRARRYRRRASAGDTLASRAPGSGHWIIG